MKDIANTGSAVKAERGGRARKYERASAILSAHKHNDILVGDELAFMRELFAGDARFPDVTIVVIKIAHAPRPYSMFKCFWCLIEDGRGRREWVPWSLKKALGYKVERKEKALGSSGGVRS